MLVPYLTQKYCLNVYTFGDFYSFSGLALLVARQEGHPVCKFSLQQSAQVLLGEVNGRPDLTGNNLQKIKNSIGIGVLFSGEIVRLCGGYNYDSTSIRRPFDERSTAV